MMISLVVITTALLPGRACVCLSVALLPAHLLHCGVAVRTSLLCVSDNPKFTGGGVCFLFSSHGCIRSIGKTTAFICDALKFNSWKEGFLRAFVGVAGVSVSRLGANVAAGGINRRGATQTELCATERRTADIGVTGEIYGLVFLS